MLTERGAARSACKEKRRYDPVTPMRAMESFIRKVGGYSFLYADTFLTKEELREMFDHTTYDRCAAGALSAHKPPPGPLPITGERLRVAVRGCQGAEGLSCGRCVHCGPTWCSRAGLAHSAAWLAVCRRLPRAVRQGQAGGGRRHYRQADGGCHHVKLAVRTPW